MLGLVVFYQRTHCILLKCSLPFVKVQSSFFEGIERKSCSRTLKDNGAMSPKASAQETDRPVVDMALEESLSFNSKRVNIINCDPASGMFVTWFHVSCYFPVLTACLGPIANTISIACVVESWREKRIYENGVQVDAAYVKDPAGIFAFNVISLVLGFASNIALLLHFNERLSYLKAQCLCIVGWTMASFMLLIDVIVCAARYFESDHEKSIGFWYAAITSGLYFGCTIILTTHFVGYACGKYPARFNLIKNERSLMVFTVAFSIILIWGGGMFSGLLHRSFGTALYFSVVSILTVGLGDILPTSVAAKILILVFSTVGLITLALIIAMTRGIFQESSGYVVFFHRVELLRQAELKRIANGEVTYTQQEAFEKMQEFRKLASSKQKLHALLSTLLAFVLFWNLGSMVFMFAENCSYFNAIYFGYLCFLTIGYGDYAPRSAAGRAFFVLWALGAIPLMSVILSTVGDFMLDIAQTIDLSVAKKFKMRLQSVVLYGSRSWDRFILNNDEMIPEDISDNAEDEASDDGSHNDDEDLHAKTHASDTAPEGSKLDASNVSTAADSTLLYNLSELEDENPQNFPMAILHIYQTKFASEQSKAPNAGLFKNTKLDEMQLLLSAFRKFRSIAKKNKKYSLTFDQWTELANLYVLSHDEKIIEDPSFWFSDYSPLRFPLDQPRFVVTKLLLRIEDLITNLLADTEIYQLLATKKVSSSFISPMTRALGSPDLSLEMHSRRTRSLSI